MNNILENKYLLLLSRLILGGIFIYAAIQKIIFPAEFSESILNYRMLPEFSVNLFAILIPWLELLAGIFLILGVYVNESVLIINLLLVIFVIMIFIAILMGLNIECGCFGTVNGQRVGGLKIIENLLMLLLGIHVFLFNKNKFTLIK